MSSTAPNALPTELARVLLLAQRVMDEAPEVAPLARIVAENFLDTLRSLLDDFGSDGGPMYEE